MVMNNPIKKMDKRPNRHFSKEDMRKAQKLMKTCSKSLILRDTNQNNNEVPSHTCQNGYHQQINKWQVLVRMRSKRKLLVGMQTGATTVENSMEFPQKTKNGIDIWLSDPTCRSTLYLKKLETPVGKNMCTPMFIIALFTIAKIWKQPKCPSVDEWITKMWYISTMEYYAVITKKELLPFETAWRDLESIMLSKISQSEKEEFHMISLICGI